MLHSDRKPRVMMVGLRGFPSVQGGVETHAENLCPLLVDCGWDVEVVTRTPYQPKGKALWKGVRLTRVWAPKLNGVEAFVHTFIAVLYAAIRRPDVLHLQAIGPAVMTPVARLFGLRVVVTHHGPDYDRQKWGGLAKAILRLGESFGMRYSTRQIVISNTIYSHVKETYGIDACVIPNGVTLPELPESDVALCRFGLTRNRYILLVSRLVPEKRHFDLMRAFDKAGLDGWKLVFVGAADHGSAYSDDVFREAGQLSSVVMTGFQTGIALRELYAHAGFFVLPSSHEGLPIALLEALSFGLHVIASDIPANLEVGLAEGSYFPLGNVDVLAERIRALGQRVEDGLPHVDRGAVVSRYNWRSVANETSVLYAKACG